MNKMTANTKTKVLKCVILLCFVKDATCDLLTYNIFTRETPNFPEVTNFIAHMDDYTPLFVIIHGYVATGLCTNCLKVKDELLKKQKCIVVLLDWSSMYNEYNGAVSATKLTGHILAEQLLYVIKSFLHVSIIGFGLGAHVGGFTGKQLKTYGGTLGRIVALDPAAPLYNASAHSECLWKDDAKNVIVYHCDGGRYGISENIGTLDYYINGGEGHQPGCSETDAFMEFLSGDIDKLLCHHRICQTFYIHSINSNDTMAVKCDSLESLKKGNCTDNDTILFGENTNVNATGTYYVNITST